VLKLYRQLKR